MANQEQETLICEECEGHYIIGEDGKPHHIEDTGETCEEMDAHHEPYGGTSSGNTVTCESCGGERHCDGDGNIPVGKACPICGHIEMDQESLCGAGMKYSGE